MSFRRNSAFALTVMTILSLESCGTPPQRPEITERESGGIPRAFTSGSAIRWEGEQVYYFSSHAPGAGILSNPFTFSVDLMSVPPGFSVTVGGQGWPRVDFEAQPPASEGAYAYRFGAPPGSANPDDTANARSAVYLSIPQQPRHVDHGQRWSALFTDKGGSKSTGAPKSFAFDFVYVERGRCTIEKFAPSVANPAGGMPYSVEFATGGTCKAARVTVSGSATPVSPWIETRPDLGGTFSHSLSRAAEGGTVVYQAEAWDAAGNGVSKTFIVSIPNQPSAGTTTGGMGNMSMGNSSGGGTPACPSILMCVSCPSSGGTRNLMPTYVAACSADEAKRQLQPSYTNCTITEGACPTPAPSPTP